MQPVIRSWLYAANRIRKQPIGLPESSWQRALERRNELVVKARKISSPEPNELLIETTSANSDD